MSERPFIQDAAGTKMTTAENAPSDVTVGHAEKVRAGSGGSGDDITCTCTSYASGPGREADAELNPHGHRQSWRGLELPTSGPKRVRAGSAVSDNLHYLRNDLTRDCPEFTIETAYARAAHCSDRSSRGASAP